MTLEQLNIMLPSSHVVEEVILEYHVTPFNMLTSKFKTDKGGKPILGHKIVLFQWRLTGIDTNSNVVWYYNNYDEPIS